jgi:hypothetical protein
MRALKLVAPSGLVAMLLVLGLVPPLPAGAQPPITGHLSVLDAHADTTGAIVISPEGYGYVTWDRPATGGHADTVLFCKMAPGGKCTKPLKLPMPGPDGLEDAVTQPFPVLGASPGTVFVVAPRYVLGDEVIWTSTNGGASFSPGHVTPPGTYSGTTVDDVLRVPDKPDINFFVVASHNVGLKFSLTSGTIAKCATVCTGTFGAGGVFGASLALASGDHAVEAYWTLADKPTVDYYWSKYGDVAVPSAWEGPVEVAAGGDARLVNGPKGLFLLSQDFDGTKEPQPTRLDIRKWRPATHTFGPPTVVVDDKTGSGEDEVGGLAEDPVTGALYVAWGDQTSSKVFMRLWVSGNGGKTFSAPTDVAPVNSAATGPVRIAVTNGRGFLTFQDDSGLELVDLAHL